MVEEKTDNKDNTLDQLILICSVSFFSKVGNFQPRELNDSLKFLSQQGVSNEIPTMLIKTLDGDATETQRIHRKLDFELYRVMIHQNLRL